MGLAYSISYSVAKQKSLCYSTIYRVRMTTLRNHAYSNILKILPSKNEHFQIKKSVIFLYFCSKLGEAVLTSTHNLRF